jgi:hypothetical protein
MSYTPKQGDTIRDVDWIADSYVTVTAIGERVLLARGPDGFEEPFPLHAPWELFVETETP